MNTTNKMIITHAGSFHADEVMACALLEKFLFHQGLSVTIDLPQEEALSLLQNEKAYQTPTRFFPDGTEDCRQKIPVIRTRDAKLLEVANKNPNCFVIDVGGNRSDKMLNFDHHQKSMKETWNDENKTPLSSTGLVWLYLKNNAYLDHISSDVLQEVEDRLIKPLDQHDNGLSVYPWASIVGSYNRDTKNTKLVDEQFIKVLNLAHEQFDNVFHTAQLKIEATLALNKAWETAKRKNDTVVLLPRDIAYHDCAGLLKTISNDEANILVIPGSGNRFSVVSLPIKDPFSIKCPMPQSWRGKMNFSVPLNNKKIPVKFAHKTGFMCVVEGSAHDALSVGREVIKNNLSLQVKSSSSPKI